MILDASDSFHYGHNIVFKWNGNVPGGGTVLQNKGVQHFFSSPEPKAHGELIVFQSSRRPSVHASVHTFKHEYLRNQQADCNQILSEASLGCGKGCIRFLARSDWNFGFHGNR